MISMAIRSCGVWTNGTTSRVCSGMASRFWLIVHYFFFFNDTAPTEIYTAQYTLSLHDALPISTNRAGAARGAVHARRVELHHAIGVGQPAVAHRGIVRVELLDLHGLDRGIERVCPLQHQVERFLHAAQSVGAGDDDRLRDPTRRGRQGERGAHRVRNGGGREPARGGGDEIPTRQDVSHGAWF